MSNGTVSRSPLFWALTFSFGLTSVGIFSLVPQVMVYLLERGLDGAYAARALARVNLNYDWKGAESDYQRAMELAAERQRHPIKLNQVLAIGDSVRTDLAGAHGFGIDCLFVTRGIHAEDFEGIDQLNPAAVKDLFGHPPRALTRELRW